MKRVLFLVLSCTLLLGMVSCGGSDAKKIAEQVNKELGLPKDMGGGMIMQKVEAGSGNELRFVMTLPDATTSLTSSEVFIKSSKDALIQSFKAQSSTPEFQNYAKNNITLTYVYQKEDGSEYATISVKPEDYK